MAVLSPEQLFLVQLPRIEKAAAKTARRERLSREESESFVSWVKERFSDDDYAIIRELPEQNTFSTYLTTVVNRLALDFQTTRWGKWRPSAEAERLGHKAVQLEKLLVRNGLTLHEAIEILLTNSNVEASREELEELAARLPQRVTCDLGALPLSAEITQLYSQIRELVARSTREPKLRDEIDRKMRRLRTLQKAEAEILESQFEERLHLRSGTGWAHLQRIKERLGND